MANLIKNERGPSLRSSGTRWFSRNESNGNAQEFVINEHEEWEISLLVENKSEARRRMTPVYLYREAPCVEVDSWFGDAHDVVHDWNSYDGGVTMMVIMVFEMLQGYRSRIEDRGSRPHLTRDCAPPLPEGRTSVAGSLKRPAPPLVEAAPPCTFIGRSSVRSVKPNVTKIRVLLISKILVLNEKKRKKVFLQTLENNEFFGERKREITSNGENAKVKKTKKKKKVASKDAEKRGVCYLSRIPPHMDHVKLRHILSRLLLFDFSGSATQVPSKRSRGSRDQEYSEGWVEFGDKRVAKRVANMLNGEQIGGRKRSSFYYDLWNIKYLSKFKWDDLTEELAFKKAIREQKLAVELSAAKRERDFYLSRVDQSRALNAIEERLKKKQKIEQDSGVAKVIRHFPQTKPIAADAKKSKPELSDDVLDAERLEDQAMSCPKESPF
ncbi:hypothetical protein V8G54_011264 [Vigna mungo]|uniref:Pre-rRNA-processing protein ESF2 n=1 Tax=Vigna mungo TaxID=3915 RepID=A0AAQ3S251_VIGMU